MTRSAPPFPGRAVETNQIRILSSMSNRFPIIPHQRYTRPGMARISVLIPSYNHARFIDEALRSVEAQTFSDLEIVVLDDGSTDETPKVLEAWQDRAQIEFQENAGTYPTLNRLIDRASGELIAILNSDDLWAPRKLEMQIAMMDAMPSVGLVHTDGRFIDGEGRIVEGRPLGFDWPRFKSGNIVTELVRSNRIIASSVLVRRECFESCGRFDERFFGSGDWDMWLRIAMKYDIGFVDEPLTFYRVHGENASRSFRRVYEDDRLLRREKVHVWERDLLDRAPDRRAMESALAFSYACLGEVEQKLGDFRAARAALRQSLRRDPKRLKTWARLLLSYLRFG